MPHAGQNWDKNHVFGSLLIAVRVDEQFSLLVGVSILNYIFFLNLFIFGCVGSSLLRAGFL